MSGVSSAELEDNKTIVFLVEQGQGSMWIFQRVAPVPGQDVPLDDDPNARFRMAFGTTP